MSEAILYSHAKHAHLIPSFARIHMDCILNDHTVVTFLPPLDLDVITQSWIAQASTMPQTRQIILTTTEDDSEATGVVMLSAQRSQTWAFQRTSGEATRVAKPSAEVGTAFRSIRVQTSHYATRGLATRLMRKLEEIAQQKGITNLMLDTEPGSAAESLYPTLGYQKLGVIPEYSISPKDGSLKSETWFWKNLQGHGKKDVLKPQNAT